MTRSPCRTRVAEAASGDERGGQEMLEEPDACEPSALRSSCSVDPHVGRHTGQRFTPGHRFEPCTVPASLPPRTRSKAVNLRRRGGAGRQRRRRSFALRRTVRAVSSFDAFEPVRALAHLRGTASVACLALGLGRGPIVSDARGPPPSARSDFLTPPAYAVRSLAALCATVRGTYFRASGTLSSLDGLRSPSR